MTKYSADPFPYWVIDDFLPQEDAWAASEHFHDAGGPWTRRHHLYSRHKETRAQGLPETVERVLQRLEGEGMRHYLAQLSDFPALHADPERFGGGQHVIYRGGRLGIHADFTHHPTTGMRRALNLLLYLNPNWKAGDGGELELWSADMQRCVKRIEPLMNRAVLFKTSMTSFHGHPEPLKTSERRSLAVYYYTKSGALPMASDYAYVKWGYLNTTNYHPRPWEYGLRLRRWVSKLVKGTVKGTKGT